MVGKLIRLPSAVVLLSLIIAASIVPNTLQIAYAASVQDAKTYASTTVSWLKWDHSAVEGRTDAIVNKPLVAPDYSRDMQGSFQCAEFVTRSLAAGGLIHGIDAYNSPPEELFVRNGNNGSYSLRTVKGLYDLLMQSGLGLDFSGDLSKAREGDVVFFGDVTQPPALGVQQHVELVTRVDSNGHPRITAHNGAEQDIDITSGYPTVSHIVQINWSSSVTVSHGQNPPVSLKVPAPYNSQMVARDVINPDLEINWNFTYAPLAMYTVRVYDYNDVKLVDDVTASNSYRLRLYPSFKYGIYRYEIGILGDLSYQVKMDSFHFVPAYCLTQTYLTGECAQNILTGQGGGASTPTNPTSTPQSSTPSASDGIQIISVPVQNVRPGQQFQPSVTIKVVSGSINSSSDFLKANPDTDGNKLGAYVTQGFTHSVSTNQTYTFDGSTTSLFKMTAPNQIGIFNSTWRLWIGGAFKGPTITIQLNVQNDTSGPPPGTWRADYFNDTNFANGGGAYYQSYESGMYLFHDWGINSPGGGVRVDYWSARFSKSIEFPGGQYHFHASHDDAVNVYIDGTKIMQGNESGEHDWTGTVSPGSHEVKAELVEQTGAAHLEVWWQGPGFLPLNQACPSDHWCAQYWGNKDLNTQPPLVRDEGTDILSYNWVEAGPGYYLPTDYFSARWTRNVYLPCGTYRFLVGGDDGIRFWLDDVLQMDKWPDPTGAAFPIDINIAEGYHSVRIDYFEVAGVANMQATWSQLSACAPPTATPTATPLLPGAVTLLALPGWHLTGNNGDVQAYQNIDPNALVGKTTLRVIYNLHGLQSLGNDASALIFDQGGNWHYTSLFGYGQNGLDGQQTVDIPLSDFPGLNPGAPVGTLHTRFWYSGLFTVDITSIVVWGTAAPPTSTSTPTASPTSTSTSTSASGDIELLTSGAWHLVGNNGDAQAYQSIPAGLLAGKTTIRVTYDLHGLQALANDASAIIFDQGGSWHYISLSGYGQNGKDGLQTTDIPLSVFPGLDLAQSVGTLHTRFWYSGSFTVDITSIKVLGSTGTTVSPTVTPTRTATPTSTASPTNTATSTGSGVELLTSGAWHLTGNNGDAQAYQSIPSNVLSGKTYVRVTYNLHGLSALGNDASAIIFDQGGNWHYISLSGYGQNGKDGAQTIEIPLSDFSGLNLAQPMGTLHTRFWYGSAFTIDITSIIAH